MISFFLGIPGSGKTYYGVNTIYDNFSITAKSKKYENCQTNINEFKYDLVNNTSLFDFDEFLIQITELYEMYRKKSTDKELIEKAKEFNIYKTLFVLDECHRYFDVERKVLVWWLTYHRHLYHDIILITQNLSLLNSKYKPLGEAYYKAKSRSLTLGKGSFKYMYYASYPINRGTFVNTISLKMRKEVFNLYHSGDSVKSKNVIKRFIYISMFFLFLLAVGFYLFLNSFKDEEVKPIQEVKPLINKTINNQKTLNIKETNNDDLDFENKKFVILNCSLTSCSSENLSLPIKLFKKFEQMKYIHTYYYEEISKSLYIYYTYFDKSFYDFMIEQKQGGTNEKDINNDISLFGSTDSK